MHEPMYDCSDLIVCPVEGDSLSFDGNLLRCPAGHVYPVVEGVAVMLRADTRNTISLALKSRQIALEHIEGRCKDPWFVDSLGVSDEQKAGIRKLIEEDRLEPDPVISYLIGATNGILYKHLIGQLREIPIPVSRLPISSGGRVLDLGCSWGRWSLGAARLGYRPIGLDPSLGAVLAAKRLAKSLGLPFEGVVGDARYIPVASAAVDAVFSYSVLQHFSKADALLAFAEASRVLTAGGLAMIQMASATGIRSLQHQLSRRFSRPENFDVRYWMPGDLLKAFQAVFGSGELSVDCFFGLGLQASDAHLMPLPKRSLIVISECLRAMSAYAPLLTWCADSVYLTGRKNLTNRERSGG